MHNNKGKNNPNWKGGKYPKKCPNCQKVFLIFPSGESKYCSRKCFGFSKRGKKLTEQQKNKISEKLKGRTPWNKGKKGLFKHTEQQKLKIKKRQLGSNNSCWKGDKVGYKGLHQWIRKNKLIPEFCEDCGKRPPHDCHNISGEYKRDLDDWKYICRLCHRKYDKE